MKNLLFIIFISSLILGCKTKQSVTTTETNNKNVEVIEVTIDKDDKAISFKAGSNSEKPIYLLNPQKVHIEKFDKGEWVKLKILPCPCDAPCARPEEKFLLNSKEFFEISWDMNESWCGEKNEYGIRKTEKEKVNEGNYRIRFVYNYLNENKIIFKDFEI